MLFYLLFYKLYIYINKYYKLYFLSSLNSIFIINFY